LETSLKITILPPFWKTWWFVSILAMSAVAGIWGVFYDQKLKSRKEKELVELRLKTIKSQIDPHFAFNALNTVASFIYAGDPDVTYDYFTRFASMIRNILKDHDRISRTLKEEADFVKNYLELQKIRFKEKFSYEIIIDETIPPDIQVPVMIIQSYAENAVKHGLMHRAKDGELHIRILRKEPCILISIEDNGVGREKAAELNPGSTGMGLKMMDQIITLYRKLYHTAISQTIEDLTDEQGNGIGTRVTLTICSEDTKKKDGLFSFKPFKKKQNEHG
jgi:LytS/YehU family sensor histidine kinase